MTDVKIDYIKLYEDISAYDKTKNYTALRNYLIDYKVYLVKEWDNFMYDKNRDPRHFLLDVLENAVFIIGKYDERSNNTVIGNQIFDIGHFIQMLLHDILNVHNIELGLFSKSKMGIDIISLGSILLFIGGASYYIYKYFQ